MFRLRSAFSLQSLNGASQRLDDLRGIHFLLAELQNQLEFFGGGNVAESIPSGFVLGMSFFPGLFTIDHSQGKAPNQVAHPRFLVLAGYLEPLRFRKDPLLDAESFDLVGNRAQAQDLGYGRSSLAESLSDLFMGKTKAVAQGLQAVGLFKGC